MLSKILKEHIPIDVAKMRAGNFMQSQIDNEKKKLDKIKAGSGWQDIKACPLCHRTESTFVLEKHGCPLVQCLHCELWYHTRTPANLDDVYKDDEYEIFTTAETKAHFQYKMERFGRERVALLETVCGSLSGKKILEVGCGNGYVLAAAKEKSSQCYGSEFSKKNIAKAIHNTGLPIYPDPLESFPQKDFDIIMSFDVLEHVEHPVNFVQSISNLLKPGGYILFYTPNYDSFSVKLLKEYSSYVDPTEHIILFNSGSLQAIAERTDLEVVYMVTRGLDISNIIAYYAYLSQTENTFLTTNVNDLQAMVDHSGSADSMRVIYRKK